MPDCRQRLTTLAGLVDELVAAFEAGFVSAAHGADDIAATVAALLGEAYRRLVSGLRDEGVLFPPSPRGTGFVSSAHGAKDIEQTLAAVERVLLKFYQEDQP